MSITRLFILDNSCLQRLRSPRNRARLRASLRATGREFWPTGTNVLEAVKTRDRDKRTRLLVTLAELAEENHAMTLPTEALRKIAVALSVGAPTIDWSEPKLTAIFRDPESLTDDEAADARELLLQQEASFTASHDRAQTELRPRLKAEGGHARWTTPGEWLDEAWSTPSHLSGYIDQLWEMWGLPGSAPVADLLKHEAWRLYFDGWGASVYARQIAHPQRGKVQSSDLQQLVYLGPARGRILATDDIEFRALANAVLKGRYQLARVVSLEEMLA